MNNENITSNGEVLNTLSKMIAFQRKWRITAMFLYVLTTIGTVICSAGATILGALNRGTAAAVLAAIATVFVSVEKSFLFREKWKLHLTIESRLQSIKLDIDTNQPDLKSIVGSIQKVMEEYSTELPIAPRD